MAGVAEIVVAGGGPAGATIARLLALRGRRPVIIDPGDTGPDRLEVIAPAMLPVIDALRLTPVLADPTVVRPCVGIRRRWGAAADSVEFLSRPGGRGFVVDRSRLDARLRQAAAEAGVEFRLGKVAAVWRDAWGFKLLLRDGTRAETLRAASVIDATGRPASVARRLGANRHRAERLVAGLISIGRAIDEDGPKWLEVASGRHTWEYSLAGPGERFELWRVARDTSRLRPLAYRVVDASSAVLSRAAGAGWMAVGDAAASFDPVTSQGLGNALGTALAAAGAILSNRHPGSEARQGYCDLIWASFSNTEWQRQAVYRMLDGW